MNSETVQSRRRRKQTNSLLVLVIAFLILFFGSFFLLRPILKNNDSPIATTQRFIGFIELRQYDNAHNLMTPTFQSTPSWHGILYQLGQSLDPAEAGYHVLTQKGDAAEVQFSNESGGYLFLKKVNGKWLIADPNEVPQLSSQPGGTTTSQPVPQGGSGSSK